MASKNLSFNIEKLVGEQIPLDVVQILECSGFDSTLSLSNIDEKTIVDIEQYVNDNLHVIKNTIYANATSFKFKPGHKNFILQLSKRINELNQSENGENEWRNYSEFTFVLSELIKSASDNYGKTPNAFRYTESIRNFAIYIYLHCGRGCYETLSANLPIPQASTICEFNELSSNSRYELKCSSFSVGYISQHKVKIIEGELRCKELKHFLESIQAEKCVWLSEDASGIVAKIEHDPQTDQMIGLVLPISTETGLPIPFTFMAQNEEEIRENMPKVKSTLVYMVMAQPLMQNAPPFPLQIFGTNNKFRSQDVLRRWNETVEALKRYSYIIRPQF